MAKITAAEFATNARSYIGQPYSKIDCAKLVNLASKGRIKATGSNYQWRYETSETGRISDGKPSDPYPKGNDRKSSQLEVGMGVFMHKKQDTKKYPDGLGDYCHVGVVTSVKPLRITNSNDPKGVMDYTRIGTFCAWCRFSDVDYGDIQKEEKEVETMLYQAKVIDGALKVRNNPAGTKIGSLKNGSSVDVYEEQGDWCRISQGAMSGWVMKRYLQKIGDADDQQQEHPSGDYVTRAEFLALAERVKTLEEQFDLTQGDD